MQKVGIGENASETEHAKDSVTTTGKNNHHSEDNTIIVMNVMLGREVLIIAMHLCSEVREGRWKDKRTATNDSDFRLVLV